MATIVICDRCGIAEANTWEFGDYILSAINDINLPDNVDLCVDCHDKLTELIRAWWWKVQTDGNNDGV